MTFCVPFVIHLSNSSDLIVKYFSRGRELQRRLTDREVEIEMDNRDRQKEKEELEELKAKIYAGDSNNPEYEFAKVSVVRWTRGI